MTDVVVAHRWMILSYRAVGQIAGTSAAGSRWRPACRGPEAWRSGRRPLGQLQIDDGAAERPRTLLLLEESLPSTPRAHACIAGGKRR